MIPYQLTAQAQQDLIQIRRYTLVHWGEKQSIRYLEGLKQTFQMLSEMPLMGRACADLGKDIYRVLYDGHAVYYFTGPDSLIIIAVLHQSMVPKNHLKNRL